MEIEEVGAIQALLTGMTTLRDGSLKISFEVNPSEIHAINRLMELFLIDERLFCLGITRGVENRALSDV
jgi:hypothetical protein